MSRGFIMWLAVCTVLGGCTVGPNYQLPRLALPSSWRESTPKYSFRAVRDASVSWWRDFDDPVLNDLVERALQNNEALQVAVARITEARGLRESTQGELFPHVGAAAGSQRGNPGVTTEGGVVTAHQAVFDAAWELDLFGGTRREIEAEKAIVGAREAAYRNAALSLAAEVAREYVMLRQFQEQRVISRRTATTRHELYDIAQDHYKGGLVSTLDVAQADTLYKTTLAKLPEFDQQIKASAYRLSVLLGENPGKMDNLIAKVARQPVARRLPVLDAPARVIRQRPDVVEAERNLAAATALQGVALSALYPNVSLSALFGVQHASLPLARYLSTLDTWNPAGTIAAPILEFGSIKGQIDAADARQVQALHEYREAVLGALGDVEIELSNLTEEARRHKLLRDAGSSADHAVMVAQSRYRNGLTDFTTVLQAEQQRFGVQLDLAASQAAIAQNIIALHKALGENPAPGREETPDRVSDRRAGAPFAR